MYCPSGPSANHSSSAPILSIARRISGIASVGDCFFGACAGTPARAGSSPTMFSSVTKRLQTFCSDFGVFASPMPMTSSPASRMRLASRVKSLSDDTSTKPSNRPECRMSMASMTSPMSLAFLPLVFIVSWCAVSPRSRMRSDHADSPARDQSA